MGLVAKSNGGGDFPLAPAGNHVALCYAVVDLGEHESEWQGKTTWKRRVRLAWELCDEVMEDGRPFSVSKEYTLSLNEKANLRHDLEAWRNRPFTDEELEGFDVFAVLGAPCMVQVVHQKRRSGEGAYEKVAAVTSVPKGTAKRKAVNSLMRFSLEEDGAEAAFAALPEWLQKRINIDLPAAPESEPEAPPFDDDDIPF